MDINLESRINNVGRELERILEPLKVPQRNRFAGQSSNRILKKWKYKPREVRPNKFLSQDNFCPYENVVLTIKKGFPGFNLHSYDDLMYRCARIQDGCIQEWLDWDDKWVNPITLSSKGWDFYTLKNGNLTCKCTTCSKTLSLKLNMGSGLNKRYWEKYVSLEHSNDCPWRRNQFDLPNEYHLQPWNLIRELQRIYVNRSEELISVEKVQLIPETDGSALPLLLRGYQLVESDVARCTGCFKRAFVGSLLRDKTNFHARWCKYFNPEKLKSMIEQSVKTSSREDIGSKLEFLENYFENM